MSNIRKFFGGWNQPKLPVKGISFSAHYGISDTFPESVDLRPCCSIVYDQLNLGSCVAHSVGGLAQYLMIKLNKGKCYRPSMLDLYYLARQRGGLPTNQDTGATVADGIAVTAENGLPPTWIDPYDTSKFAQAPSTSALAFAKTHKIKNYYQVSQDIHSVCSCLAAGWPISFGFAVYRSFLSDFVASKGIMPIPSASEIRRQPEGGHAVLAVGYNRNLNIPGATNSKQYILCRNSWSSGWGLKGYFWMPFEVFFDKNFSSDMWTADSLSFSS